MKAAKLRVTWGRSPSADVLEYLVFVINEDTQEILEDRVLSFAETQITFEAPENANITATVTASDGTFHSQPVSASYSVGDLSAPQPVGYVGFELLEIVDYEDEDTDPVDTVEGGDSNDGEGEETVETL